MDFSIPFATIAAVCLLFAAYFQYKQPPRIYLSFWQRWPVWRLILVGLLSGWWLYKAFYVTERPLLYGMLTPILLGWVAFGLIRDWRRLPH